ncbi:MAG: hypothetical protein HeimC3_35840 [Candidatus Heimdallarchaeota archaeon LC_3]|nr:MAG: hypothetical protein HeimC3_35840 [Candidatus Heimdallarchaeota archaeon LC_3]
MEELNSILERAKEFLTDLEVEYNNNLKNEVITTRAKNITNDFFAKLKSALDHKMYMIWEKYCKSGLSQTEIDKIRVYYPITNDENSFRSTLGRSKMNSIESSNNKIYEYILDTQPFRNQNNMWLKTLSQIANEGKHVKLSTQKRKEDKRITVSRGSGSVSYGPGVKFGSGVSVMGAKMNPNTQRINPTPGVTENIERLVSFVLEDHSVNALGFAKDSFEKITKIIRDLSNLMI